MKRLILMLAMIALPLVVHANMTGRELHFELTLPEEWTPWVVGYSQGYIDGVIDSALGCPARGIKTHGQALQIVKNYLEVHPEEWNKDAAVLIQEALDPVCKYKETK